MSAARLEVAWHGSTCTPSDTISAWKTRYGTRANQRQWESRNVRNWKCATRMSIYTYSTGKWSGYQSCCICHASQARPRIHTRFADAWWKNHWLVLYVQHSNGAEIDFEDESSLLSQPEIEEEHWITQKGFWSVLLSTTSGHCKVHFTGYRYTWYWRTM